jgi:hypothetical protein
MSRAAEEQVTRANLETPMCVRRRISKDDCFGLAKPALDVHMLGYFAGLPQTCALVRKHIKVVADTFAGGEPPLEILARLGVDTASLPQELASGGPLILLQPSNNYRRCLMPVVRKAREQVEILESRQTVKRVVADYEM